jgi:hypothetical protein
VKEVAIHTESFESVRAGGAFAVRGALTWSVASIGASVRNRTGVDRLSADCSATELEMRLSVVEADYDLTESRETAAGKQKRFRRMVHPPGNDQGPSAMSQRRSSS